MKLTLLLTVFCTFHALAGVDAQTITVKANETEISRVLTSIERQGQFRFLFNSRLKDLQKKVTVDLSNVSLGDALKQLFAGTSLTYRQLDDNLIALRSTDPAESDIRVTGRVTNESGDGIAAVSVQVKGTSTGTTTDAAGNFAINVPENATLVFSAIGFESKEVAVGGRQQINISLTQSTRKMDEVVVIGYGQASKRDLTGSITKVLGKEIADKPNTNPVASLQSKVAGLYVVNNGTPGKEPDIRIRGTQSIGQVKPLYIVDGIFQDNIDYINPNDIESIEVMKDPSSLAIFGVRGGTGVIAITTKRAKTGQTIINYNATYGVKNLVDKIKMASASQFDELFAEENANNGVPTPDYSAVKNGTNTDWIDAVTRKGKFMTHNISMSGTSDKNKFNFGLGYISDEGMIIREKLKKYLISFSDEYRINKAIKVGLNLNASRQENPYNAQWVLDAARKVMPHISPAGQMLKVRDPLGSPYDSMTVPVYYSLVSALQNSGVVNPVLEVENTYDKTIGRENRYVGSFFTDVSFLKDFNLRATWYADVSDVNTTRYNPLYYAFNPVLRKPELYQNNGDIATANTSVENSVDQYRKYQQDYILTYKKKMGDHSITATGGFTTFYFGYRGNYARSVAGGNVTALQIPNDPDKWTISNGFGKVLENGSTGRGTEFTTVSLLGRLLYNYRNKYYLNASLRDDASSRIPPKNRHQQFWAVGAAWEISKEDFMQNIKKIDYLKLKASTGVLGNQSAYKPGGGSLDYPFYPGVNTDPSTQASFGTIGYISALPAYLKNPDLKWETINSFEVGLEANAFSNRLHFEYNYYSKVTKDMMTYIGLSSIGFSDLIKNGGEIKNWGHEFSASWNQRLTNDLTLTLGGNITFMKNKVISVAEDLPGGRIIDARANNGSAEARTLPGFPIGSFYGYVVEGIYQTTLDILNSPFAGSLGAYAPGDFKFKDVNGDGIISDLDRAVIGNPSPDFIYGGSVGLNYKRLNLNVDFGGVYGNEVFRVWGALESPFQRVNYPALKYDRWHGPGTSNWEPIISQKRRFNYNGSTYNIEDGSYFRIRNLQLGYDVDTKILSRVRVKGLRVFVNIQNLKTWKNNNGYTAEFGGSATAFGFDEAGGAIPRVTTFGLNLNF